MIRQSKVLTCCRYQQVFPISILRVGDAQPAASHAVTVAGDSTQAHMALIVASFKDIIQWHLHLWGPTVGLTASEVSDFSRLPAVCVLKPSL